MVPSGSLDAVPFNVVLLAGSVREILLPALDTGLWLAGNGAAFTVTVTMEDAVAPALSVTCNVNIYTPCTRLVSAVDAAPGLAMV